MTTELTGDVDDAFADSLGGEVGSALRQFRKEAVPGVCDTGRYRCRYYQWGDGPALVMIHGLTERAWSFAMLMRELKDSFRCVAYEMPAGGTDRARVPGYRHADYAADLVALMDHLGLESATPLGCSYGTTVALAALRRYPGRLPRAVVQGVFARRPLYRGERALCRVGRYLPGRMRQLPFYGRFQDRVSSSAFAGADPDLTRFFTANVSTSVNRAVAYRALLLDRLDLRAALPRIPQPVLIVTGEGDRVIPESTERAVESELPNARRVVLPGCGHYPAYIDPKGFAREVRRFAAEHPGGPLTGSK